MVGALSGIGVRTELICGVVAGIVVGNPGLGFQVGATCTLMSIGFYTYGGATIPDFVTGAMLGTVMAKETTLEAGLTIAVTMSLIMTQLDILGRASTTVFQHLADGALAKNSIKKFEMWTLAGTLPWFFSRAIPVFVAILLKDQVADLVAQAEKLTWFSNGLRIVGRALPAVGFALLLSYMDLKKYWPFLVVGYVLFAFVGIGTIGLALLGAAAGFLFTNAKGGAN
jgi:PTS system mannose-specific IIC component